jgi:heterodisulfide reductase subunit A
VSDSVLVIGGGIAGIQAALDLAHAGAHVVLVEREATIGGNMAVLDKNFPTLDCSICIEAPKMSEVDLHPNIEILSLTEAQSVSGMAGDFSVTLRQRARYVTDNCTRCGECTTVCPVILPNEYDSGMAARKAIYTPIPQSAPGAYVLDMEHCLNRPPNYLPCDRCSAVCPPGAIDYLQPPTRTLNRRVASVVVAVGYDMLDPRLLPAYGYGSHPDILTSLEFERLVNSAGPTGGEILRPSDGRHPERLLLVLCVGSRDRRFFRHCSRFCCMVGIKHAYQALDHGIQDVTVLTMDVRAYGKGFDAFLARAREGGARFVRGRPATIEPLNGALRVRYEETSSAARREALFDLVVLSNAVTPAAGLPELAERLGIALDTDGFLEVDERGGGLVATTRPGIYAAGCVSGPKDIPDSVAEASGAAALALRHLTARRWPTPPQVEARVDVAEPRVGVFVCHCGSNIAGVVDVDRVVEFARGLPDVVYAGGQMFSCAGNTQAEIEEIVRQEGITRVVVAACSPKTHETTFRGALQRAGLNPYLLQMTNIRNMDSWVHKGDPAGATIKAMDMVWMAVEKARLLKPLYASRLAVRQNALVVGGGIAGITAATALARQGFETHLVEREPALGGLLARLHTLAPAGLEAAAVLETALADLREAGAQQHLETTLETVGGVVGSFDVRLSDGEELQPGALVIATGARPHRPTTFGYGADPRVITNLELEAYLAHGSTPGQIVTFLGCVGSRMNDRGCSRYCCASMIGQALALRRLGKTVRVLTRDVRTYTRHAEEQYEAAMRAGVQFFRLDPDQPVEASVTFADGSLIFYDQLIGRQLQAPTDVLVLTVGLEAADPDEADLVGQLKLARSEDGFLMELHPKLGPVETAAQGIYLAGAAQGAKDTRESVAQGLAAAAKAGALLARGEIEKEPLTAQVDLDLCIGCMRCVKACPYGAIEATGPVKEGRVRILEAACMGCGTCAAECNFDAIDMPYFTRAQILAQIDAALAEHPHEKCLVFACNWCSYAGADLAGIEKRQYPASARIIRTMCSARLEEAFIARAFENGAGAVLVTGCRLTDTGSDCHYNYANRLTAKRFRSWQRKYRRKGVDEDRFQLRWISAAEGKEFAEKITEMDAVLRRFAGTMAAEELDHG